MSRQRTEGTSPEMALRKELHRQGLRYRLHVKDLPGRPDLVFVGAKVAVFVDGCFWHCCPQHRTSPKNNAEWWAAKLRANIERDRRQVAALEALGWRVIRVWEHEPVHDAAPRIVAAVRRGVAAKKRPARSR